MSIKDVGWYNAGEEKARCQIGVQHLDTREEQFAVSSAGRIAIRSQRRFFFPVGVGA